MQLTALVENLHVSIASTGGLFLVENGFSVGPNAVLLALDCNSRDRERAERRIEHVQTLGGQRSLFCSNYRRCLITNMDCFVGRFADE